jgi:hypothetical protein
VEEEKKKAKVAKEKVNRRIAILVCLNVFVQNFKAS